MLVVPCLLLVTTGAVASRCARATKRLREAGAGTGAGAGENGLLQGTDGAGLSNGGAVAIAEGAASTSGLAETLDEAMDVCEQMQIRTSCSCTRTFKYVASTSDYRYRPGALTRAKIVPLLYSSLFGDDETNNGLF